MGREMGKKRFRRTTKDIDDLLLEVVKNLVEEIGFSNITISAVVHRAQIEPITFYNRFNDITDLFEKYVRTYDYWMNDLFAFNPIKNTSKENITGLFKGLIDSIYKDASMQRILAWEISDNNYITKRTARTRENHSELLIDYFKNTYSDDTIDIRVVSALIIGGIYYICLHKDLSTFCTINFDTEEGIHLLKKNVVELVNRIYSKDDSNNLQKQEDKTSDIKRPIRVLYEKGVDIETIQDAFELSAEEVNSILGFINNKSIEITEDKELDFPNKKRRGRPKKIRK